MLTHYTFTRGGGWRRTFVGDFISDFDMRKERRFSTEASTKAYLKERGGEVLHGLVEGDAEDENGERRGKRFHWLVEHEVKAKVLERLREMVHRLIEIIAKGKVCEGGGKGVHT